MSSSVVDSFATPWQADASGLWALSSTAAASRYGTDGLGLEIRSSAGAAPAPAPFAERNFAPPLDLRDSDELRFWLRSSRPGDGTPSRPIYLALEATRDPPVGTPWRRLLPVSGANTWELQRVWLGDMTAALRQAVGFLRLRSLDGTIAFAAAVDDLIATAPRAIEDVDAALLARLDGVWSVPVAGVPTAVPAILDLPESPGTRTAPYVLVTPWSVTMLGHRGAAGEVIDNYTTGGAHVRPTPVELQLEYRIDVYAQDRGQKATLLDLIVVDLLSPLVVDGVAFELVPFRPSQQEAADLIPPGRTPLFVRLVVPVETGVRVAHDRAVPFLVVGHIDDRAETEALAL